jgi:hypothetical protein
MNNAQYFFFCHNFLFKCLLRNHFIVTFLRCVSYIFFLVINFIEIQYLIQNFY